MSQSYDILLARGKSLSGLTPELEQCLKAIAPVVVPLLPKVTDAFFVRLLTAPHTAVFLENDMDRFDDIKQAHLKFLTRLFESELDAAFVAEMIRIGDTHAAMQIPLDFLTGAMGLICKGLIQIIVEAVGSDSEKCLTALQAVSSVTALALMFVQTPYQLFD